MATHIRSCEQIVDAALNLAEQSSWEAVRLFDVAAALGIGLDDVRKHFKEKEDVIEAWFDRADRAVLAAGDMPGFGALPARARLHRLIMVWLEALSSHRRVTRQMLLGRLEPGHIHVQVRGLLRVSRTVQWIREGARRDAAYLSRALEESVLTGIYLATLARWLNDGSPRAAATRSFLDRLLRFAERLPAFMFVPEKSLGPPSAAGRGVAARSPPPAA